MSITFSCEHCGKKIKAPESKAGRKGKCPKCNQTIRIPLPSDETDDAPKAAPQKKPPPQDSGDGPIPVDWDEVDGTDEIGEPLIHETATAPSLPTFGLDTKPDVRKLILQYVVFQVERNIVEAEAIVRRLLDYRFEAVARIQTLLIADVLPESLEGIAREDYIDKLKKLEKQFL